MQAELKDAASSRASGGNNKVISKNSLLFVTASVGLNSMFLVFCRMRGSRGLALSDPPLACFFALLGASAFRYPRCPKALSSAPPKPVSSPTFLLPTNISFTLTLTLTVQLPFVSSPPGRTASSCRPGSGAFYLLSRVLRHFGRSTCILPRTPLAIQQLKVRDISHLTALKPSSAVDHMIAITVSSTLELNSNHLQLHFHCA